MTEESLKARLGESPWRQKLRVLAETDSTNTRCRQLGRDGAESGTAVLALRQSAGRGRLGRSFLSPEGGLYLSVLLRPRCTAQELLHLTAAAGAAAAMAVERAFGLRCGIKWTNDLICGGRKLAGILAELSLIPGTQQVDFVVLGIGVNCREAALSPEVAAMATSLERELGRDAEPEVLAAAMLEELEALDRNLFSEKAAYLREFSRRCVTVGKQVQLLEDGGAQQAFAEGIGENGELLVRLPDGSRRAVACGEVSVRGLYGYLPEEE